MINNTDYLGLIAKQFVGPLHAVYVSKRRTKVLSQNLVQLLPKGQSLCGLDIGCGKGDISAAMHLLNPEVNLRGTDILLRTDAAIPVIRFDGHKLPFDHKSFDFAMIVDVLHHTQDPSALLKEAMRVSRHMILIKDHFCQSLFDNLCLRFMDWVGNRAYDVNLPYLYLSKVQWRNLYQQCGLLLDVEVSKLNLYNQPFNFIFDRDLHFIAKLLIDQT